jgi:hypothetical protein
MVHRNVWNFEKIWLIGTLIIIRKPKVWRTDMRIPLYLRLSSIGGIKTVHNTMKKRVVRVMVCNATLNNIPVISWQSIVLVGGTGVSRKPIDLPQGIYKLCCIEYTSSGRNSSSQWYSGVRDWLHIGSYKSKTTRSWSRRPPHDQMKNCIWWHMLYINY